MSLLPFSRIVHHITKASSTTPSTQRLSTTTSTPPSPESASRGRSRSRSILFIDDFLTSQAYKSLKPLAIPSSSDMKDTSSLISSKERPTKRPKSPNFFDRMRDSPIRRCTISGAKLPSERHLHNLPLLKPHQSSKSFRHVFFILDSSLNVLAKVDMFCVAGRWFNHFSSKAWWSIETWQRLDASATIMEDIVQNVENGLQNRIIQELELLAERIRCLPLPVHRDDSGMAGDENGKDVVVVLRQFHSIEDVLRAEKLQRRNDGTGIQAILNISGLQSSSQQLIESTSLRDGIDFVNSLETGRTIPIYDLAKCLPPLTHPDVLRYLTSLIRSETRYLASLVSPTLPTPSSSLSPILSISSTSLLSSQRSPADPVPLLIALWRLVLWSSPHGRAWTVAPDGAEGMVGEGEEVVEGFKEVQGVMHTRW